MAIQLSPLAETDIPRFVRLELEAFRSHPRIPMLWPRGYTSDLYAYYEDGKTKSFYNSTSRFMKAVDESTSQMMAVSQWDFVLDPEATAAKPFADPNEQPPANWPKDGNWELRRFFKIEWEEWTRETLGYKPYIELLILVVNTSSQRRGAGTKLLSWGCGEADKLGVIMCLESTPAGLELYRRFGFREIRTVKADMRQFGWDKPCDEQAASRFWMLREPQAYGSET